MKQIFKLSLLLLALLLPAVAAAYDFEVDGIYYIHSSEQGNVEVTESPESARYAGHVTIPETVTYNDTTYCVTAIGAHAFYYCNRLTGVTIPNSVTVIRGTAFFSCSGLTSIKIPSSVTYIAGQAFTYCDGLMSLTIPSSVTYIGFRAFEACSALTSITVESGNPKYDSRGGCNAIIETASNKLVVGCKNTVIPNSVTCIDNSAFSQCFGLTRISIPASITCINNWAFFDCSYLRDMYCHITDPSSVLIEGNYTFYSNSGYSGRTLHVPQGSAVAYQADSRWYPYFEKIVEIDADTGLKGDVNLDGEITIADINVVVAIILGEEASTITADVNRDGEITIADINAIIEIILHPAAVEEHEWVDLGLPSGTLWATCNVGATSPEEYGDYYAWGETAPKNYYDWSTYKWCKGSYNTLTKYCTESDYGYNGFTDGKKELDASDDAATANWGSGARMPSSEQIQELRDNCSWQWTQRNGVYGQQGTGLNGSTIFLPATGYFWYGLLYHAGMDGSYWSRTLRPSNSDLAYNLLVTSGHGYQYYNFRDYGHTVRAVRVF